MSCFCAGCSGCDCESCRETSRSCIDTSAVDVASDKDNNTTLQTSSDAVVRRGVINRLAELGHTDECKPTDSTEKLRALLHKKLGRFVFTDGDVREYSKTYYFEFDWEYKLNKFTQVLIAARYHINAHEWEYGVAWRNPLDKPAPNLAKKIARKKMIDSGGEYITSYNSNPDWYEMLAVSVLGSYNAPRWAGNEARRLENLAALWRDTHAGSND